MINIYLVRHGQNEDNAQGILNGHRDKPLTKIGIDQAHQLAKKIQSGNITFSHVYTSPLQRASKTAQIISNVLGLPQATVLPALIERDFGIMSGKPQSSIEALCAPDIIKTDTITYFLNPPGAETFPQLIERAANLLAAVNAKHDSGNILLVTHGDFGKMIYGAYYNLPWQTLLTMFHFGNSDMLELSADSPADRPHVHTIAQFNT